MSEGYAPPQFAVPLVECEVWKERQVRFKCQFCKCWHYHGRGDGHRAAHCWREDSPYLVGGYIVKEVEGNVG